ncbi:hypothetical protein C9374_012183 [Naegleria lovaniensis]|uniref:Uncharacterized protein n=1 Tax=Naegleria lovaniensis TaxID=51637 RepID=A0AA88KE34_NAELO|nr:uncharacterized protein C9374_012183 [Naegleria lovaniensis]KAG2373444.1 hypothetical protein C9374_012183 [Naegleria lovaniensis]
MSSQPPLDLSSPLQIRLMLKEIECETLKQKLSALECNPMSNLKFERWDDSIHSENSILQQRFHHMLLYIHQLESDIEAKNRRIDLLELSLNNRRKRRGGAMGDPSNTNADKDDLNEQTEQLTIQRNLVKAFMKRRNNRRNEHMHSKREDTSTHSPNSSSNISSTTFARKNHRSVMRKKE